MIGKFFCNFILLKNETNLLGEFPKDANTCYSDKALLAIPKLFTIS